MKTEFIAYDFIVEIHNPGDQAFLKSLFEAEGITYFFQGEYVAPYLFHALPMRLMVKKEDADRAREILKDMKFSPAYSGLIRSATGSDGD